MSNQLKSESPVESSLFKVQGDHVLFPDEPATERMAGIVLVSAMLQTLIFASGS